MSQDQGAKQDSGIVQGLAVGAGGTVVGGGVIAAILAPQYRIPILIFLVVAVVLVVVAVGVFLVLRAQRRKYQTTGIERDVTGEFDRQAASSNDPEIKARLEKMKRKFMLLIETLRKEGHKNIYEMPWFLTLGPSGSGKSWVLKGSGLEPLTDDPWKGGTFLIDWWSCPEALVLDTAGGVVFREEKGYESPEWQFLLGLLKKHRPQCPVNGVLVMVPAQLLWLRDDELPEGWLTLEDYANALRMQIRKKLQRDLGVRFPVYFLVTQSDRLPGFREFADALDANGKPKGQMVGWSLPVEVGKKPLKQVAGNGGDPESEEIKILDQRLREVASDLRRQRLMLLRKYAGDGARPDELGMGVRRRAADLFTFPDAIQSTLAPRLKDLLEKVFKPDPMLPKMLPFLRGVYFTSALREGEVLDRQRTGVGRTLASLALPGGADNEQPNPFFLKDLVPGKAFSESGLVTPLVQARAYLRQRRRLLIWSGIGAGLLLLIAIIIGGVSYSSTVGGELFKWQEAKEAATNNTYWLPVVKGDMNNVTLDTTNLNKQVDLAKVANAGLERSSFFSFRWLFGMGRLDHQRRQAQLHLFERGVIWPMADLARQKILASTNDSSQLDQARLARESQQFQGGLLAMLELELSSNHTGKGYDWEASRDRVMDGLVNYVLATQTDQARAQTLASLKSLFNATYQARPAAWPPDQVKQPETLSALIENGFARMSRLQANQTTLFDEASKRLRTLVNDCASLKDQEKDLVGSIESRDPVNDLNDKLGNLKASWNKLTDRLNADQVQLFLPAFTNFATQVKTNAEARQGLLRQQVKQVNGALEGSNLIPALARGLDKLTNAVPTVESTLDKFRDLNERAAWLDATVLAPWTSKGGASAPVGDAARLLSQRFVVYAQLFDWSAPSTRQFERSLFEETGSDPKEIMETFSKAAVQACAAFQMGAFAGLTNDTAISYESILSQFVEFRYLEKLLAGSERETSAILESGDCNTEINPNRKPRDICNETGGSMARLKKLDSIWDELKTRWVRLGGRGVRQIKRNTDAISAKRDEVLGNVAKEIGNEREGPRKFPLAAQGDVISENEIRKYRQRALDWKSTFDNPPADAKAIPSEVRSDWERVITDDWLAFCDRLIDENGDIRDYEVRTPWGDQENAFKTFLRGDNAAFQKAKQASGTYRVWTLEGKPLQADTPNAMVSVNAASAFTLEARREENSPAEKLRISPRNDGWTVIAMLGSNFRAKRPPYFVSVEVLPGTGGQDSATVWFMIRPVSTRNVR
jgi:hypothetical protein